MCLKQGKHLREINGNVSCAVIIFKNLNICCIFYHTLYFPRCLSFLHFREGCASGLVVTLKCTGESSGHTGKQVEASVRRVLSLFFQYGSEPLSPGCQVGMEEKAVPASPVGWGGHPGWRLLSNRQDRVLGVLSLARSPGAWLPVPFS